MRTNGKNWRKYVTFLVMAFFAYAVQPNTMIMAATPQANTATVQNSTVAAAQVTLHNANCCHGMMVCPGLLACHGISMQAAFLPVQYQSIQTFVPAGAPERLSGRRLAPTDPPPIHL